MSDPTAFKGFIAHQDGCVVVIITGDVDLTAVAPFSDVLARAIEASPRVVLDMADVTFLDSSGLRVLASGALAVGDAGSVTIRHAPPHVVRVLAVSGLEKVLTMESIDSSSET